jgi:predicted dehydrogenase
MSDNLAAGRLQKTLGVAVLGIGHWGPNLVRNLAWHPRVRVRCVCDTDVEAFARVANFIPPGCVKTTAVAAALKAPGVDAVVVATPAATHYRLAKAAIEAGKHVLCEKPLATRPAEALSLCRLAARHGVKLMVGHTFLFNSAVHKIKELIDAGEVGRIHYLTATRTHLGPIRNDTSVVWDLAPHDVVIMNYLLGAVPESVSAVGGCPMGREAEDFAFIHLFYPEGVIGEIHVSWIDSHKTRLVHVIGDQGHAVFNDLEAMEPVRLYRKGVGIADRFAPEFGEFKLLLRDGDIIIPKVTVSEPLARVVEAFVRLALDGVENPSQGACGVNVARVLAAVEKSIARGGAPERLAKNKTKRGR